MPRKIFTAGEVLAASDVNTFLMDQAVQTFTDSTARESAISTATAPAGLVTYLEDEDAFEYWNGTAYEPFGVAPVDSNLTFVLIGGGGGAGGAVGAGAGGGGGGGYISTVEGESSGGLQKFLAISFLTDTNYPVSIGSGGAGGANNAVRGGVGSNSSFANATCLGGGGGGAQDGGVQNGITGGCGGGVGNGSVTNVAGSGSLGLGFAGGISNNPNNNGNAGAGGGGAGAVGSNFTIGNGGAGGAGITSSITGSAVGRAGGGGGGGSSSAGGATDGGGAGAIGAAAPTNGTANTGGGGGSRSDGAGANGGSGVLILKYPDSFTITIGAGLTGTTVTSAPNKITTITAGAGNVSWAA